MADGNILFKYDLVLFNVDLNGIGVGDAKLAAKLLGHNDSTKLVDMSYNSGRFHKGPPLFDFST